MYALRRRNTFFVRRTVSDGVFITLILYSRRVALERDTLDLLIVSVLFSLEPTHGYCFARTTTTIITR